MNGLSKYYIKKIINCFSSEMTATETSRKLKINRNTVNKYYRIIREAIVDYQELQLQYMQASMKEKEIFYFSWHKNIGLIYDLEQGDAIFSIIVKNNKAFIQEVSKEEMQSILATMESQNVVEAATVVSKVELEDVEYPPNNTLGNELRPITGISEAYFNYAKDKLTKFYGVKKEYTYLYLKELEFRFNNMNKDLGKIIWRILPHHSTIWKKSKKRAK